MNIEYLIIHCTNTPGDKEINAGDIWRMHTSPVSKGGRGWRQMGYTDLIHLDGNIERLVPNNEDAGVDCWKLTSGVRGIVRHIAYVGGIDVHGNSSDTRTPAQHDAISRYVLNILNRFPEAKIRGHNDLEDKECPCFNVRGWLTEIVSDKLPVRFKVMSMD